MTTHINRFAITLVCLGMVLGSEAVRAQADSRSEPHWRITHAAEHWGALGSMKRSSIGQYGRRQIKSGCGGILNSLGRWTGRQQWRFPDPRGRWARGDGVEPVGWGLAAAGGAIGLGLGLYKLARWAWKKYKKKTLGKDRRAHAASIVASLEGKKTRRDKAEAEVFVEALGLKSTRSRARVPSPVGGEAEELVTSEASCSAARVELLASHVRGPRFVLSAYLGLDSKRTVVSAEATLLLGVCKYSVNPWSRSDRGERR